MTEPTVWSAEVSKLQVRCAGGKIAANNMADVEEEILLRANVFLLLVLKRRHRQLQNRLQNLSLRHRQIKFLANFSPAVSLFVLSFKSLMLRC